MAISEDEILNTEVAHIKIDVNRPGNKTKQGKTLNKFGVLLAQVQAAATQLDAAKMLARGAAVKAQHAKHNVYHTHRDFDMYHTNPIDAQLDHRVDDSTSSDSIPSDLELDAYFSSIDVNQCNEYTLRAYAAHQQRRQSGVPYPFDPKTMIPKDAFMSSTKKFCQAWGGQNSEVKAKIINAIQNSSTTSTPGTSMSVSTAIVPYKEPVPQSASFMELEQGPLTTDVLETFLNEASISSVRDLQVYSSRMATSNCGQSQPLILDINNISSKTNKSKKDRERNINDLPEGSIYKMFSEPASESKLQLHNNGEFIRNITLVYRY